MSAPRVSVLLSVYNGRPYVAEAVRSVLEQDRVELELLVRDDGSTDGGRAELDPFRADPRFRWVDTAPGIGLYAGMNLLAQVARAPLLRFFCQDDRMLPGGLARSVEASARYPDCGYVYSACGYIDESGRRLADDAVDRTPCRLTGPQADLLCYLFGCISANLSTLQMSATLFREAGGFRPDLISADFELMARVQERSGVGRIPEPTVLIRRHEGQWSRRRDSATRTLIEDAAIYAFLRSRLIGHGLLSPKEADRVISIKYGWNAFHRLVQDLLRGDRRAAADMRAALNATGYAGGAAWGWFRTLPGRLAGLGNPHALYASYVRRALP